MGAETNKGLPLWSCFVAFTFLSLFFLFNEDYTLNYIFGFNLVLWMSCGIFYALEAFYKKNKK